MTFTPEEEKILKLIVQEMIVKRKYAEARKPMNEQIRNETIALSNAIQEANVNKFTPFITEIAEVEASLKERCK